MFRSLIAVSLIFSPLLVTSCATSATVRAADVSAGQSQDFTGSYDLVRAAALQAVERMNVDVQGSDETPERFQIRFSKPVSAFSWGEVGVVNVVRVNETTTRVFVNSERRHQLQVTGTSEQQFANEIFGNITEALAQLQP